MRSFRVGSLFGVPVRLDLTFLLVLPVFAFVIGVRVGASAALFNAVAGTDLAVDALTAGATPWLLGSVAAVGLFVGVLAHELGHSLVAMHYDHPIESITLWLFGGIAQLTELPEDWREELAIALAGPAVSVAVGAGCLVAGLLVPSGLDGVRYVLLYLAVLNVALAAFNLVPAFPMDGGRVLRALLGRTRTFARATQIAADVGKVFAILLGVFGLLRLDPIAVGVAVFVFLAGDSEAEQVVTRATLEGVTVADVMTPVGRLDTIDPGASVRELEARLRHEGRTGFPVVRGAEPVGVATAEDAQSLSEDERGAVAVGEVASGTFETLDPSETAMHALSRFRDRETGRALVVRDDRLVGSLTHGDLLDALAVLREGGDPADARRGRGQSDTDGPSRVPDPRGRTDRSGAQD